MRLTWRQRLENEPSLRDFSRWPAIPVDSVPRKRRKAFLRNQRMVEMVLGGQPLHVAARQNNVSAGRLSQLLERCLGGDLDDPPALTKALVPHAVVVRKRRSMRLPTLSNPHGTACAFDALLESLPELRAGLDAVITAKLKDARYAQTLTPQALHGEFKRILAEHHWPLNQYPFTTTSIAYESVRRYLHTRTQELQRAKLLRRSAIQTDIEARSPDRRPLRCIQIDEQNVDLRGRIQLELNGELIPLRVARATLLVAIDVDSDCVLGYFLAPTRAPTHQDMLFLIANCLTPWEPRKLETPHFSYSPGACFPSGMAERYPVTFGVVQLDNAWIHRAGAVKDFVARHLGATLHFGLPKTPTTRRFVEQTFDYINKHCTHRFASTTGSHPKDPKRESHKNQKRVPVLTFQTLDEALSVVLTEHNVTPQAALGAASPLDVFRYQCGKHFVRYVPHWLSRQWDPLHSEQIVALHWYKHEGRVPHVNFQYVRYQGPGLGRVAGIHPHIRVRFDRKDIRTLHAFTLSGEDLGTLLVSAPWRRFAHSVATRQRIHKLTRKHRFSARDPLSGYFRFLLDRKGHENSALSLLQVYTEFSGGTGSPLMIEQAQALSERPKPSRYVWEPTHSTGED